jgi:hypothetical protein
MSQLNLLARTIVVLAVNDDIQAVHLAEALHTVPMLFGSIGRS